MHRNSIDLLCSHIFIFSFPSSADFFVWCEEEHYHNRNNTCHIKPRFHFFCLAGLSYTLSGRLGRTEDDRSRTANEHTSPVCQQLTTNAERRVKAENWTAWTGRERDSTVIRGEKSAFIKFALAARRRMALCNCKMGRNTPKIQTQTTLLLPCRCRVNFFFELWFTGKGA